MKQFPEKYVIDTNVPKTANLSVNPSQVPLELEECVLDCIDVIEHVINKNALVLDTENEIFDEYRDQLSMSGQPGPGDKFMKWVHDNRFGLLESNQVEITKKGNSYNEFPTHKNLKSFDKSDHKFLAVSNAHPEKPPILEATDSKWWGFKDAIEEIGLKIIFVCPEYIRKKYQEKLKP